MVRFVPAVDTPNGPLYGTRQLALARVVKAQTDVGTPASAVEATIAELNGLPAGEFQLRAARLQRAQPHQESSVSWPSSASTSGRRILAVVGQPD